MGPYAVLCYVRGRRPGSSPARRSSEGRMPSRRRRGRGGAMMLVPSYRHHVKPPQLNAPTAHLVTGGRRSCTRAPRTATRGICRRSCSCARTSCRVHRVQLNTQLAPTRDAHLTSTPARRVPRGKRKQRARAQLACPRLLTRAPRNKVMLGVAHGTHENEHVRIATHSVPLLGGFLLAEAPSSEHSACHSVSHISPERCI
jgi:hypothetical protein